MSVLLSNQRGSFRGIRNYGALSPLAVALGDLNIDGKPDIVICNSGDTKGGVLLGKGDGDFRAKTDYRVGIAPHKMAVRDINADRKLDLAFSDSSGSRVWVLLGKGDGTFPEQMYTNVGISANSFALADLNGDKKLDFVIAADGGDSAGKVFLGNGDGTFRFTPSFAGSGNWLAIGDSNGDNQPDLVSVNALNGTAQAVINNSEGVFRIVGNFKTAARNPSSITLGDLNGDALADLIIADYGGNSAKVLINASR